MKSGRAKSMEEVTVSDHAIVRWLERVHGIDVDYHFRQHIADMTREAIDLGATSIQIDGFLYVLDPDRRTVVTIYTSEQRKNRHAHLLVTNPKKERV